MRSDYRGTEIFYRATAERAEDFLSTADYCFRYDTECHWMTNTVPPLRWKPVRYLLGKYFLGSTNLISWSNRLAPLLENTGVSVHRVTAWESENASATYYP